MRSRKNGLGNIQQHEIIPWNEIKPGMILMNYGHSFYLQIHFVDTINDELMKSTYLEIKEMGMVTIEKGRYSQRQVWERWAKDYNNTIQNDFSMLFDKMRDNTPLQGLIDQAFAITLSLELK